MAYHPRLDHELGAYRGDKSLQRAHNKLPEYRGMSAVLGVSRSQLFLVGHSQFQQLRLNFVGAMDQAITKCGGELSPQAAVMINEFFTAQQFRCCPCYSVLFADCNIYFQTTSNKCLSQNPSQFIGPVGIVAGIFGGIAGFMGPAAIVAGFGSVVNGLLTEAGLKLPR